MVPDEDLETVSEKINERPYKLEEMFMQNVTLIDYKHWA